MKKNKRGWSLALLALGVLGCPGIIFACPTLQLDILGGTYSAPGDGQTNETIVSPGDKFTLFAFLIPNSSNTLNDTYYISAALVPMVTPPGGNLGSFSFGGQNVIVTTNMTYGIPPLEAVVEWDKGDLPRHGIFETYFKEFAFQFNSGQQINPYNTQDRAKTGRSIPTSGSGMYFVTFEVNVSGLSPGYIIHFDLYNTKLLCSGDIDVTRFAPFSHDAESRVRVPDAASLLLAGCGLLGIGLLKSRNRKNM